MFRVWHLLGNSLASKPPLHVDTRVLPRVSLLSSNIPHGVSLLSSILGTDGTFLFLDGFFPVEEGN